MKEHELNFLAKVKNDLAFKDAFLADVFTWGREKVAADYELTVKEYNHILNALNIQKSKLHYIHYTNGINDILVYNGGYIPDGYKPGRTGNFHATTQNTEWYTNGLENCCVKIGELPPTGFVKGLTSKTTSGYKTYNNGKDIITLPPNSAIPVGFSEGRINTEAYKRSAAKRKKTIYNNGEIQIKLTDSEVIPSGFVKGKLKKSHEQRIQAQLLNQCDYPENFMQLRFNKENSVIFLESFDSKPTLSTLCNYFNIKIGAIIGWLKYLDLFNYVVLGTTSHSSYEQEFKNLFPFAEFESTRKILDGQEIDLYSEKFKLGIEFNGLYWHSSLFKPKDYHFNKSKLAEKNGIRLIHIYENEWVLPELKDKILSLLNIALNNKPVKIYARHCEIKQISNKEAKAFNDKNHLQGHRNAQVTYGLFYNGNLVQLMSFSKTKYNRNIKDNASWEIIRGCPGSNNIVVGGVSKLFKHFVNDYNPDLVFSYCDFNKFDGIGYEKLGMQFIGYTGPDLKWWMGGTKVVNRQPKKHKELAEKAIAKIWGAGSKKYVWKKAEVSN